MPISLLSNKSHRERSNHKNHYFIATRLVLCLKVPQYDRFNYFFQMNRLDLSHNPVTIAGTNYLAECIDKISRLNIDSCEFEAVKFEIIAASLRLTNHSVSTIYATYLIMLFSVFVSRGNLRAPKSETASSILC